MADIYVSSFLSFCKKGDFDTAALILSSGKIQPRLVRDVDYSTLSPLHYACQHGNVEFLKLLVQKHDCDLQSKAGWDKRTPLHEACSAGQLAVVKVLLDEFSCDPQYTDDVGQTPLHYACSNDHVAVVKALLEDYKVKPECTANTGATPLHYACSAGHVEVVRVLLEDYKVKPECTTKYGDTPLHYACRYGHVAVVKVLLEDYKVKPECTTTAGETPLHIACDGGHVEVVRVLLEDYKVKPECTTKYGDTPLHYACRWGRLAVIKVLLEDYKVKPECTNNDGDTPLHYACSNIGRTEGWGDVADYLMKHMDPKWTDRDGGTLLHFACWFGRLAVVKVLIEERNCNPECTDSAGWTPLHQACNNIGRTKGFGDVADYLMKHMDPKWTDRDGGTLLHFACWFGRLAVVKVLIEERNCNPECTDSAGWTPLHQACKYGHVAVVRALLEDYKVKPECTTNAGDTPLHFACRYGHFAVVRVLLEDYKVKPECTTNAGDTPLHFACELGHADVVSYLLKEANCNVNCTTNDGRTPITFVASDHTDIIKELIRFGANAKDVYSKLPEQYSKQPAESATKVFMLGYPGAGKTTLTAALKIESRGAMSRLVNRVTKVPGIQLRTAGIIPHDIESDSFGRITLYDFAGHEEFYAGHDSFLRSAISGNPAAVFVVVADLRKSDEMFAQTLLFWLAFIQNQYSSPDSKSHVVIAGSHADKVKSKTQEAAAKHKVIASLLTTSAFSGLHFAGFVALNCCYAESPVMTELRQILTQSCETLKIKAEISCINHCFLLYLLDKFRKAPGVTVHDILSILQRESATDELQLTSSFPDSIPSLCKVCDELNYRGNLLFLKNTQDLKNSWIVLDQGALLSSVSGTIFAPEDFKQHQDITTTSTGVVPLSKITTCIGDLSSSADLHPDLIAQFLCHLEFCHEITDHNLLPLLKASTSSSPPMEKFFFFPALVRIKEPEKVWEATEEFSYHFGWMLQCSQPEHFFLPRFLRVLLLRLAFSFALSPDTPVSDSSLPVIERKCSVWKNGISWANRHGVEALVEVVENSRRVNVMLRCLKDSEVRCAQLRSAVIAKVLDAKTEFCPKIMVTESFVTPDVAVCYPLKPSESALITATEIAKAIVERTRCVLNRSGKMIPLYDLLKFEPYADVGEHLLHQLFNEQNPQYSDKIPDEYFLKLSDRIHHKLDHFIILFETSSTQLDWRLEQRPGPSHEMVDVLKMWREQHGSKGTYQTLRSELDQFSIFSGRDPLVLAQAVPTPLATDHV